MSAASDIFAEAARNMPRLSHDQAHAAAHQLLQLRGAGLRVPSVLRGDIEQFLFHEARLLDDERYEEWFNLLAEDLFYWMPVQESRNRKDPRGVFDPGNVAYFDESKADIALRLRRIRSGVVWTEDPATRHVYMVSNIEAFSTNVSDEYEVHSVVCQYRSRVENDEATVMARRRDIVRQIDGEFRLARRMIIVPQSVFQNKNISAFF